MKKKYNIDPMSTVKRAWSWLLHNLPGIKSKNLFIKIPSFFLYGLTLLLALTPTDPSPPSLEVNNLEPTSKEAIDLVGVTNPGASVSLMQNGAITYTLKSNSDGTFAFHLEKLSEGTHNYSVEACLGEGNKQRCISQLASIEIDRTPPHFLDFATMPQRTIEREIVLEGKTEANSTINAQVDSREYVAVAKSDGLFSLTLPLNDGENLIQVSSKDAAQNQSQVSSITIIRDKTDRELNSFRVTKVIDGDTIQIENGKTVRYIGIDTPETVHPSKPVQCYGKEASEKNKELVLNKNVYLEKDVSETDRYGRLLRYVWVGDLMVNKVLVERGYAQASSYPPDIKYQPELNELQKTARETQQGLWGDTCKLEPTPKPTVTAPITNIVPTATSQSSQPIQPSSTTQPASADQSSYSCNCSRTCTQMTTCEEAMFQLNVCGCKARDGDSDGIPCENLCR